MILALIVYGLARAFAGGSAGRSAGRPAPDPPALSPVKPLGKIHDIPVFFPIIKPPDISIRGIPDISFPGIPDNSDITVYDPPAPFKPITTIGTRYGYVTIDEETGESVHDTRDTAPSIEDIWSGRASEAPQGGSYNEVSTFDTEEQANAYMEWMNRPSVG